MAGNSKRRGAMRKEGTKKGMVVGSGGQRRRALQGKGPTPPAEMRPGHPAARRFPCDGAAPEASARSARVALAPPEPASLELFVRGDPPASPLAALSLALAQPRAPD